MGKNNRIVSNVTRIIEFPLRNCFSLDHSLVKRNRVNLEWVNNGNIGDMLAPVIFEWMLNQKGLDKESKSKGTYHLCTVGSIIGAGTFDSVVWGSGIHLFSSIHGLYKYRHIKKYDVRALRGPITKQAMSEYGVKCPSIYGDPAILMPLIYSPSNVEKKWDNALVLHCKVDKNRYSKVSCHTISVKTTDYQSFITELLSAKKVISSSLHGIILAETYGVPAVFLNTGDYVGRALLKYYDWYFSTGRWNVKIANTIEEAIAMDPMPLPNLEQMRKNILDAFPYDLWI